MTKDQAHIILLEDALMQAQSTVQFLHSCLTDPKTFKYGYPEQTARHLKNWAKLAPSFQGCIHSGPVEGCEPCRIGNEHRKQVKEAQEILRTT